MKEGRRTSDGARRGKPSKKSSRRLTGLWEERRLLTDSERQQRKPNFITDVFAATFCECMMTLRP